MVRSAGARSTIVKVLRSTDTVVDGSPAETWETIAELWAAVEYRAPRDIVITETRYDQEVVRLRFDWMDGQILTEDTRFDINGKLYDAVYIDRDTDQRSIIMVEAAEFLLDADKAIGEWRKTMRRSWIVEIRDISVTPERVIRVRAVGEFVKPEELVSGLQQGSRRYKIFGDDVPTDFRIKEGNRIFDKGVRRRIMFVDDTTYRFRDRVAIYEVLTEGGSS